MPDDMWATLERQSAAKAYEDKLAALAGPIMAAMVGSEAYAGLNDAAAAVIAVKFAAEVLERAKAVAAYQAAKATDAGLTWAEYLKTRDGEPDAR